MPATSLIVKPVRISASGNVGGDHGGALQEFIADILDSGGIEQFRMPAGGFHTGSCTMCANLWVSRNSATTAAFAAITEHADFHRGDLTSFGEGFELLAQVRGWECCEPSARLRGLHRERSNGGDAVAIVSRECFQIGGNACAAGRIESRDGKTRWAGLTFSSSLPVSST